MKTAIVEYIKWIINCDYVTASSNNVFDLAQVAADYSIDNKILTKF